MTRKITWGPPSRRKDGHLGAKVKISVRDEGGADGYYAIDSHGLTSDQVAAKVDEIGTFHEARSGRMDGFRVIQATPIGIGGETFRVVDLTIRYPSDASYCALYVDVRRIVGSTKERVTGFPMRILYKTAAEIPGDSAIVALITAAIPIETEDVAELHRKFVEKVFEKVEKKKNAKMPRSEAE